MRAKKGLYWHFLSVIIPLVMIVFIALIGIYEWISYNKDKTELINKLDSLTSNYALMLAKSVASKNHGDLRLHHVSLVADSNVAFVIVKNTAGTVLQQYGEPDDNLLLQKTVPINHSLENKIETVGELTIAFRCKILLINLLTVLNMKPSC